jgi:hypothetical protein
LSTQQILGVVGGVVGAFFGYPQLGFVVGSLVGGLLTPGEKTEGPRVDDLKVQVSTYGAGIPIVYGTERVGGNVIWSTDKLEVEETTGGKGGAPENTTYRYYVHMGIVLCETPRDGSEVSIVQIFQDGKLIYDARSGIPIGSALASSENPHAYFVLYQGHADQLPDPGEEAWMGGPGSVPAYRGVVRIRMNAIECPGGRVPQFSFVLTKTEAQVVTTYFPNADFRQIYSASDGFWSFQFSLDNSITVFWEDGTGQPTTIRHVDFQPANPCSHPRFPVGMQSPVALFGKGVVEDGDDKSVVCLVDLTTGIIDRIWEEDYSNPGPAYSSTLNVGFDRKTNRYAATRSLGGVHGVDVITPNFSIVNCNNTDVGPGPIAFDDGFVYCLTLDSDRYYVAVKDADTGAHVGTFDGPEHNLADILACAFQVNDAGIYALLHRVPNDVVTSSFMKMEVVMAGGVPVGINWLTLCAGIPFDVFYGQVAVYLKGDAIILGPGSSAGGYPWQYTRFRAVDPQNVSVKGIIEDQCERAGESRFDVSDIPDEDTIHGYKLQNPASARSNIDPLLTAFAIYIVDEDGLIKFKKYEDISSEETISYDELGQAEDGAEPADAMPLNRSQEIDLPRSVSASYIDPTFDYQTAAEKEVRQITEATEDLIIELPIATTSDHAKQVASMILYAKWRAQNTRSFKTSRKFAFLSPGDGVTVEYPRGTFRLWRITSMTDTGALCEFNVEPGDAELYTQTAVGATGYAGQQVAPLAPPTRMVIGDWPLLRDSDNTAGPCVAMEGYSSSGWSGAELLIGDDDTNLQSRGTVSNSAAIGFAETLLGDWQDSIVDETNLLTVNVGEDELSSITRAVLLAGTSNVFALGVKGRWEIAQFQRADDLGSGRFILSGLRRGLRGTEYAAGIHEIGDTFVLLSIAGILKPSMEVGAIGQTRSYRAVSKGRSSSSAASTSYAGTGEALKPFSPVDIRKSLSGNDIVFTWHRRTRFSENVLAGIFPLGEVSERYVLELCTDDTFVSVVRTFEVTSEIATYTEAMQDFDGYVSGPMYPRVVQISDSVGRGHALEATL